MGCLSLDLVFRGMKGGEVALLINGRTAKQQNTLIPTSRVQQVGNSAHNPTRVGTRGFNPIRTGKLTVLR
ncbi:MAG: hypothetical protein RLZZ214_1557 [Verrucomicrobiota bacterium]|jgi:hypothetical protein